MLSHSQHDSEKSNVVRARVIAAHERQYQRQGKLNALLENSEMRDFCVLTQTDGQWLEETLVRLGLSVRAWQRLLKVGRTIADLEGAESIQREHLQEALSYRAIDRLLIHLQKMLG